jgi:molybdenum-dependent DNA-binding transcriptional regulator ModE
MSMRFDLVDLQLFIHVTETRSLTSGAEKSCSSFAAASARIKQMEESIGTTLLLRSAQGTTETEAGKALLYHARSMDIRVIPQSEPWAERRLELVTRNPEELPVFARERFGHIAESR